MKTRLGRLQRLLLEALIEHEFWPRGWVWENQSQTQRILGSLWRRGLVRVEHHKARDPWNPGIRGRYYPTEAGRDLIAALDQEDEKKKSEKG